MAATNAAPSSKDSSSTNTSPETNDIILTLTPDITVRRYHPSDAATIPKHASNLAVWNNLTDRMPHPYTTADANFWINLCNNPENFLVSGPYDSTPTSRTTDVGAAGPALPTNYVIAIKDEAVGSIGLELGSGVYRRTATLGYWLSEAHWGQGVMGEVAPAFMEWLWQTFGVLLRVNGQTYESNLGSQKVLQKAGFVYEGKREGFCVKNGVVGSELIWGALRPGGVVAK